MPAFNREHLRQTAGKVRDLHAQMTQFISLSSLKSMIPDLALASGVINLLNLAWPLALLAIYDRIIPHQSASTLALLMSGVLVALTLEALVRLGRNYISAWIGACFEHRLNCEAFRRLLDTSIANFEIDGASAHVERLRAAGLVRDFYSGQAILALFDLPFVFIFLIVVGLLAHWLVLVPLVIVTGFAVHAFYNGRGLRHFVRRRSEFEERRFSFITQTLNGIHSVKTMSMESMMQRRYEMLQDTNVQQNFEGSSQSIGALNINAFYSQLATFCVVAVGAALVIAGEITPGALAACITLTGRCIQPLQSALATWVRFQGLMVAQQQVAKLFELPLPANVQAPPLPQITGELTLEAVTFHFPSSKEALFEGVSLYIGAGECIAIKGESGSGKTSLLSLMAGQLLPNQGRVLAGKLDLAAFSPASAVTQIGYLPQQGVLFEGTILENLTMFTPSLEADAIQVAKDMGLDEIVNAMRNGYATQIGNSAGESVPGGVKQRIAIARALVRQPKIILFDEANMALDLAGDDLLTNYLATLKGKRTIVLVSHRPSLIKLADRVLSLDAGILTEVDPGPAPRIPLEHPVAPPAAEKKAEPLQLPAPGSVSPPAPLPGVTAAMPVTAPEGPQMIAQLERPAAAGDDQSGLFSRFRTQSDLCRCVPHLLKALEWHGTARQLAETLPHVAETLDLDGLRKLMAGLGFRCNSRRTSLENLEPHQIPCLFLPDKGYAQVVLAADDQGRLSVFDSQTGKIVLAEDGIAGRIYLYRPMEPSAIPAHSWIGSVVGRFRPLIWLALGLTIATNVVALTAPMFIMLVYGRVIPGEDLDLIPYLLGGLLIVLGIDWVLRGLRARILAYMGARGEFIVGTAIFQRILALPAWATEQTPVGTQVSRIKDFESLRDMFVGPLALLFYELPGTLVFIVALGVMDGWLLVCLAVSVLSYALLGVAAQPGIARRTLIAAQSNARKSSFLTDATAKMRGVKYSGAEDIWYERFRLLSGKAVEAEFRSQQFSGLVSQTAQTMGYLTALAIISTCVAATFTGGMPVGGVVAAMILTWRLVNPLQNGFLSLPTLVRVIRSAKQVDNLMRLNVEREVQTTRRAIPSFKGGISFARTSFRYSNDSDPVLLGVNFDIAPGQVLAIAGPNGAGKSTVLKLITGIYHPQAGAVRFDNVDIRQLDQATLRAALSYAPQRCDVFYGTIAQNLRFSYPTANDDELRWATRIVGLYQDIMALPEGFNTRVFDGQGDQLPHGFRQRLSLARTFLKPAKILLFDEPGNGLDFEADKAFQEAVERLRGKSTIVIVSHRPSHMRLADQIVYLQAGYVQKVGRFDEMKDLLLGGVK